MKAILLALALGLSINTEWSQNVPNYTFSQSIGIYVVLTEGTIVSVENSVPVEDLDGDLSAIILPFTMIITELF
ncbi:hypothetical protein AB4865_09375 [Capnocytophaga sp. ARDL2]|uniref:hypothetical protein n=1 Tax=Capnocytophaga sp. ARDL2 TaxID=3238809 RepID=UPI00355666DE